MNDMGMGQGGGQAVDPQDAANNKVMAVLSYWGILILAPYFMAKQSPFVKFHLNQGIILFVVGFALSLVAGVVGGILVSIIGSLGSLVSTASSLVWFVFMVIGSMNAWSGKAKPLPVIGGLFTALK
jgi:uncharacterized membrane protein